MDQMGEIMGGSLMGTEYHFEKGTSKVEGGEVLWAVIINDELGGPF